MSRPRKVHAAYMKGDRICGATSGPTLPIGRKDVTCGRCRRMCGLAFVRTNPHRATDDLSLADRCTANQRKDPPMSTTATGEGTPTGSNPAGVASPNSDQDSSSSARTELRSVSNDEDRQEDATRGPCRKCGRDAPKFTPIDPPNRPSYFECWLGSGCNDGPNVVQAPAVEIILCPSCGNPAVVAERVPGYSCPSCGAVFRAVEPPEVRRCTAIIDNPAGGDCGALIGLDVQCGICKATRCYQHCASLDHFGGKFVSRGGSGDLEWKLVEISAGRFAGQIARGSELLAVVGLDTRLTRDVVWAKLYERVRELQAAAAAPPAPAPRVIVGLEALDFLSKATAATIGRDKRIELAEEVIAWLRGCEDQWHPLIVETEFDLMLTPADCKKLHDRQVAELFSRLAGAL